MRLSARSRPPSRPKDASARLAEAYGDGGQNPTAAYSGGRRPESAYGLDVEACNKLVLAHTGLVKALASRLAQRVPSHIELNELVSVGMMGLVEAARRYEPALGVPFDAFARRRVHGAMVDSLRGMDWAPRSVRRMRRDVDGAISRVRHELNREPTDLEIAQALSVSEQEYHRMLDQIRAVDLAAIRQLESGPEEQSLLDVAFDPEEGPHARLERAEMREHLARAILEIPARERHILSLYYEHELTLAEIGEVIGVGESRVSQLRTQAIARLRSRLRESLQISEVR
jgi:RNA polymerase sigma factor for flagellar operon FliA